MEEKRYYRIKDISEFIGESASTLRYWESEFKELSPKRGGKGRRLYTSDDLETLKVIKFLLRTKGMHISAAKEQLQTNRKNVGTRSQALEELETVRADLKLLLDSLTKIKKE